MKQEWIVIFDGECSLCKSSVNFIVQRDRKAQFKFVPAQSDTGAELQRRYGIHALEHQTLILIKNGAVHTKSDAFIEITGNLYGFWKIFLLLKIVPRSLRNWVYSKIAKNRTSLKETD